LQSNHYDIKEPSKSDVSFRIRIENGSIGSSILYVIHAIDYLSSCKTRKHFFSASALTSTSGQSRVQISNYFLYDSKWTFQARTSTS